jgi:hypothetical protein
MVTTPKPKLNKAQRENKKEAEAFKKKENKAYKAHLAMRKEDKKKYGKSGGF